MSLTAFQRYRRMEEMKPENIKAKEEVKEEKLEEVKVEEPVIEEAKEEVKAEAVAPRRNTRRK